MKLPKINGALIGGLVACGAGGFLVYSSLYSGIYKLLYLNLHYFII